VHVLRFSAPPGTRELVGTDVDEGGRVAVVRAVQDEHVMATGVCARHAQREFVRLTAGTHEKAHAQRVRQRGRQALRVAHE
jgi:hypothetical protein